MDKLEAAVRCIEFPNSNIYYERESADGYAFLGAARVRLGLNDYECFKRARDRNYSLNASQNILGVTVSNRNMYVYTIWSCMEYLGLICQDNEFKQLKEAIDKIGTYPSGMMRYCTEEIYYTVPNVTSAAALIYYWCRENDKAQNLLECLRKRQKSNGNWDYETLNKDLLFNNIHRDEDCYHLAMMAVHLKDIKKSGKLYVDDMLDGIINFFRQDKNRCSSCGKTKGWTCPGTRGWGVPMMYQAVRGIDKELEEMAYEEAFPYLTHENFRVRAIAAWALTKGDERFE